MKLAERRRLAASSAALRSKTCSGPKPKVEGSLPSVRLYAAPRLGQTARSCQDGLNSGFPRVV